MVARFDPVVQTPRAPTPGVNPSALIGNCVLVVFASCADGVFANPSFSRGENMQHSTIAPLDPQPTTSSRPLTLSDRCDSCGAQAFVLVGVKGSELLFCGHHYRRHEAALLATGVTVQDERHRINEKPSLSANAD